jgi:lipoyl(octanoyl) transferase
VIDLSIFENPAKNIYIFKKWNWDYLEAEKFQLECVEFVNSNPHISIFLICSHPHCFTIGRGLQKVKEETGINLIDFNPDTNLPFPLYQIKRGGGLTFHYPGQFVVYPIVNLTVNKISVYDLMIKILENTKQLLIENFGINNLIIRKDLFGLWTDQAKLASIGLAVSRFNTYHGLALNLFHDEEMFMALKNLYPCGIPGNLYKSLENITDKNISVITRELFTEKFIDKIILGFILYKNDHTVSNTVCL